MTVRILSLGLFWLVLAAAATAVSQDADSPEFLPGLIATYIGADGKSHTRLDPAVAFVWRDTAPDDRLPPGKFSARWQGRLLVVSPGAYRFHIYTAGSVRLRINGDELLSRNLQRAQWVAAPQRELPYGFHALDLEFAHDGEEPRLSLYWEGPQFQLEPVPDRHLFHDPSMRPDQRFERGHVLSRALRCSACHQVPGESAPLAAPALTHLHGNINPVWMTDWLTAPHSRQHGEGDSHQTETVERRMPHFALSRTEAQSIVDYLLANSLRVAPPERPRFAEPPQPEDRQRDKQKRKNKKSDERKPDPPSARAGAAIFRTVGCLACHRVGEVGERSLFDGGDLSFVADKRPAAFFEAWLLDPAKLNPMHRMPVFRLSNDELKSVSLYLATLSADVKSKTIAVEVPSAASAPNDQADAQRLLVEQRCGACHQLPSRTPAFDPNARIALSAVQNWDSACSGSPDARKHRPGYHLSAEDQAALQAYFAATVGTPSKRSAAPDGALLLAERNCLSCHARGLGEGIAPRLQAVVAADPDLQPLLPAMSPPALTGVGDKLHDEALVAAITLKNPPLRPWLKIRMPRFELRAEELQALVGYLVDTDRVPDLPVSRPAEPDETAMLLAGRRLVTSDGFGCTSCHQIGNVIPMNVQLAAHGSDLSLLGARIRLPWYDRWVRDPARIVPRMEMPSIKLPIQGVLDNRVDDQLAAVWRVLNEPGFNPPPPNPVRIVRRQNVPSQAEPAAVLTDVLEADDSVFIKPLVIGLANRHNILFDLETNRLAGWWIGDAARQRTRAKTWFWEAGGTHLLALDDSDSSHHAPRDVPPSIDAKQAIDSRSEAVLVQDGKLLVPQVEGQFPTEFDWFEHVPGGIRFAQRLRFKAAQVGATSKQLSLIQSFTAAVTDRSTGSFTGFRRRVEIAGLSPGAELRLYVLPGGDGASQLDVRNVQQPDAARISQLGVRSLGTHELAIDQAGRPYLRLKAVSAEDRPACELEYLCELPVDSFPVTPLPPKAAALEPLDVVPGFEAVALPVPDVAMPTVLGWRNDGTLVVGSLEGRVWLARDTDGDQLEDVMTPFSDELAAPYGLAAHGDAIDVASKYALLRLHDRDGDGRAERTEVLVSGWGHTTDYHDWAVGLPRDSEGNYYLALPCQQDDRTPESAYLRGRGLKLIPRQPTADNPHAFDIEPFCAGLRFPMGLALSREGALFATDNQGNYNPFNELNHLVPGARYGFINKLEVAPGFRPPARDPAINIPHPWTRSVNGICFLYTPDAAREKLGRDVFGPYEGQLVGCEHDTRRLVRMSVERVGDTYQGAVYPFSNDPQEGEPGLEGPISCGVAPDGDLYIGSLRDSGWGGGSNTGSLVRLRATGDWPLGIAEVRAHARGLTIDFTAPLDPRRAILSESYAVIAFRRISTPEYGGPDVDRHTVAVNRVELSPDARRVTLHLAEFKPGFVYELRVQDIGPGAARLQPAEAYYTLHRFPK